MIKAALVVLLLLAVVGGGWYWYEIDEDLSVGIQVQSVDLSQGDDVPVTLLVKVRSEKPRDIHVEYLELEVRDRPGGIVLVHKVVPGFTVPAGGEYQDLYSLTLRHTDAVEDSVWVEVLVRYDGQTKQESRTIDLGDFWESV